MRNGAKGRKANGQFEKGWEGGPGGRPISEAMEFKEAALKATTPEEYADAVKHMMEIARNRSDPATAVNAFKELSNRLIGKPSELAGGDTHNHIGQMLVTSAADALKYIAGQSDEDVMRGIKRLPSPNGKGKRTPRGGSK